MELPLKNDDFPLKNGRLFCFSRYSNATIVNVTFGDVFHCSGQSNMWLPLSSSFNINETIANITLTTKPKYRNIRMMAGNSGDGESISANPWVTALQAATVGGYPKKLGGGHDKHPIKDFGATCWYFAQRLTDELEAAGKAVVPTPVEYIPLQKPSV